VIFLNARSSVPAENRYGGGSLKFYALLDGPKWENCPFSLDAEPGLLIAFRSDTVHEVEPVTFGQRFTIVTWFLS
jgi:predicted 2-oxoglutarate/Fe(II)-dependent dioxygenase YbiX